MHSTWIPIWKKAPFLRLLLPLILGVLLQRCFQFEWIQIIIAGISFVIAFVAFQLLPLSFRFTLQALQGCFINLIVLVLGLILTYQRDIRNNQNWFGNYYQDSDYVVVTINEPLLEKSKSYKAEALVNNIIYDDSAKACQGKLLLYFAKDSAIPYPGFGDKILINKNLQLIKNSGNPGAFNYQRYSSFQQIFHQAYLKKNDWVLLKDKHLNVFRKFIYSARDNILKILKKNIKGEKELGIAEALLIGYKADLDKDLVQAYTNTGVVHIIAISGLHLGLIYLMIAWLLNRIPFLKRSKILKGVLILTSLWLFAILTGASASVLRSAVMFSCIVAGESFGKKASVYNSLAASAFLLLCYNPYFLWDVGFQLSYLAVAGIVIFQKPIYNWLYIKNILVNQVWKLLAISLAAQVLTFPICLYYFHQFPNLFLISNLVAVPLSSLILFAEIFLIAFAGVPFISVYAGKIISWLIWLLNKIIVGINELPYSVIESIPATLISTILLYCFVFFITFWLTRKSKSAFRLSLFLLLAFMFLNAYTKWDNLHQQKIVVYNVPQHKAIDFINGNNYKFIGDSILMENGMLQNFHIKPGRIAMHLQKNVNILDALSEKGQFFQFNDKKILIIDSSFDFEPLPERINIDVLIISKNPKLYIEQVSATFNCGVYIFDASNPLWKINKWKKDCEELHLPSYSVPEQGAFIMDL